MIAVATSTIQKHSCRPPGATSQASTSATAYVTSVNIHAARDRQASRRQRPLRLVDAIDLEVVDLVDRVRRRVEHRRHRQADQGIEEEVGAPGLAGRCARGGDGAGREAERRRDERERPRELEPERRSAFARHDGHRDDERPPRPRRPRVEEIQHVVVQDTRAFERRAEQALDERSDRCAGDDRQKRRRGDEPDRDRRRPPRGTRRQRPPTVPSSDIAPGRARGHRAEASDTR